MIDENAPIHKDSVAGVVTTNTPTAVTWGQAASTTLNYEHVITSTVYIEETGSSNGIDYDIQVEGVTVTDGSGSLAAGAKVAVDITGRIGDALQVLVEATVDDSQGAVTVSFFGK